MHCDWDLLLPWLDIQSLKNCRAPFWARMHFLFARPYSTNRPERIGWWCGIKTLHYPCESGSNCRAGGHGRLKKELTTRMHRQALCPKSSHCASSLTIQSEKMVR